VPEEDEFVGEVVEESLNIGVYHPLETVGMSCAESLNCLMSVTARTEAKRELREVWFEKRTNHFLSHPNSDRGDAQRTKFAFPFWNVDPA
jgi:hypothetical protein